MNGSSLRPAISRGAAAAVALACLGACTQTHQPEPRASASAPQGTPLDRIRQTIVHDAVASGHTPAGDLVVAYRQGPNAVLLWQWA